MAIDYNLRPAKHAERAMLAHALRRLTPFGSVESYRYIGFGAAYFRDFRIFHRELGITDMLSIEKDTAQKERYEFNKPFTCVKMAYDIASTVLPQLSWDVRTILWLDYTDKLDRDALADIQFFCANAAPGSVLIVTVNVQADHLAQGPLRLMQERVGEANVPPGLKDKDLGGWGTAKISRRIIDNTISTTLANRNGGRTPGSTFKYQQVFNFEYADEARMLTLGGVVFEAGQAALLGAAAFESLPFARTGEDGFRIETPKLTYKELHHLQARVPIMGKPRSEVGIPVNEVERYNELYRFFPVFAPTEM
jgi:hypothetical protein